MTTHRSRSHAARLAGQATAATLCAVTLLAAALPAEAHRGRVGVSVHIGAPIHRPWAPAWGYHYRPRIGWWGPALPVAATAVTVGGLSYWYADGWYYRPVPTGGYEVVSMPADASTGADRLYVYPTKGQGAEQQASDEYECHRWAADQSGYDPTAIATGGTTGAGSDGAKKSDYARAQSACLTGRGYSVK